MNQGFFGFPDRNNSLSASLVNDQTGSLVTWDSVGAGGKQLSIREDFVSGSVPVDGTSATDVTWYKSSAMKSVTANCGNPTAYILHFLPIFISRAVTIKRFTIFNCTNAIAADALIGLYDIDNIGLPKSLLYCSPTLAIPATNWATTSVANASGLTPILKPGYYHIGCIMSAAPTVGISAQGNMIPLWWGTNSPLYGTNNMWCIDNIAGATLIMPPQIEKKQLKIFGSFASRSMPEIGYVV